MRNNKVSILLIAFVSILFPLLTTNAQAQQPDGGSGIEISAGAGTVIYQSAFATENIFGIEAAVRGGLSHSVQWQAGTRLWIDPMSPELFGRLLLSHKRGSWSPLLGIELGVTAKPKFGEGSQLLRETRNAMLTDAGPCYVSGYIAPLSFAFKNDWRISIAEINAGTHFKNMGRTLRLYVNLLSLSKTF